MRFEFLNIKGTPLSIELPIVNFGARLTEHAKQVAISTLHPALRRDLRMVVHSECQSYKFSAVFLGLNEIGTSVSPTIGTLVLNNYRADIRKNHEPYILRRGWTVKRFAWELRFPVLRGYSPLLIK